MRLVVDESTLVGELLRERGIKTLVDPRLDLYVPASMWEETGHELSKRLGIRVSTGLPEPMARRLLSRAVQVKERSIAEVPREAYEHLEEEALSRLPRDPRDWQVVALALSLDAHILTGDEDFFGCGVAAGRWIPSSPSYSARGDPLSLEDDVLGRAALRHVPATSPITAGS